MSARHLQGKKIFIDGDRGIGDMLVLTPAFRTLKEICPSCELTVGAYELPALQALERLPYIDHVRKMEDRGLGSKIRTAWQLHSYDYVVLTGYRPVLARFLHYFGVKHLSGTGKEKQLRKGWFEVMTPQSDGKIARNVVRASCGDVFRSLHLDSEAIRDYACDCSLPTAEEEKSLHDKILRAGGLTELSEYVVIAPEGFTALNIPYRLLEPLAAYLQERLDCPLVFMGKDTRALTARLKEAVPEARLIDLSGQTNVMEMYDFPTEVKAGEGDEDLMARMVAEHPEARLPESDPRSYDNVGVFTDYVKRYGAMPLWEKMRLRGATLLLFSRFLEQATPKMWTGDERMARVLSHVHGHLDESISVDTLAEVACVTKPYLIRLFGQEFGMPPLQYVNKKKMERAQLLLMTEDWSVKEVAWQLGFSDHSYFIRLFHKMTGITPQEYRNRFKSGRIAKSGR